ncbi:A disintegrin and metalloproteinase with thrombospondin motifs 6-like [Saccostrea echinata]|uniref:A disintegrin and metalloproteinase with thrombospondin motifs 6-like n=1 Tax=Saccostrea echinata TaxID=191078 RepID=UPI002A7FAE60|nr:A disintegrin and metalloproteinase with thrombospondin motifs 6-like [Saccostrea echinata]
MKALGFVCICAIEFIFASASQNQRDENEHLRIQNRKTAALLKRIGHYEMVIPTLVDENGRFLSYNVFHESRQNQTRRTRRELSRGANPSPVFYRISAFGQEFHFKLEINRGLFSRTFYVGSLGDQGEELEMDTKLNCHYVGYSSEPHVSTAAMSNCFGLHGIFQTEDEDYFVEPLWNDTASDSGKGHPHVVYKRSSIQFPKDNVHCGVTDILKNKFGQRDNIAQGDPGLISPWNKLKFRDRIKRSAVSREKNVETLVVADHKMVEYHGKKVIQSYVLSIMNIVAKLYHDASIGNAVNIVVSRLIVFEKPQKNLTLNHDADHSLDKFCKWQHLLNLSSPDNNAMHHDNAILLTGYDICSYKNEPCGTLGLAPVNGMCGGDRSCSINEDIGLASAFTIAHEIGHNFGMQHDGSGNKCGVPGSNLTAGLMAAQLSKETKPFNWSSCSRDAITEFIDSEKSSCLDNSPVVRVKHTDHGVQKDKRDSTEQCKIQYGSQSRNCKPELVCSGLWCLNDKGECKTKGIPAAEGTGCFIINTNEKGWCYLGECRALDYKPQPVDGSWGQWSEWDMCTRTCGGGIESSFRRCNDPEPRHGGKYCVGQRKRYRSCNIETCLNIDKDFRELQCADFNKKPFRGRYYNWKPFSGAHDMPCALHCIADGFNFYTEQARKVIDGTRCYPDKMDMCINGKCLPVGCDGILGSTAVEDKCRVCNGDNSSCYTVSGTFDKSLSPGTYYEITTIPKGAMHIRVSEIVQSQSYLALKNTSDIYYINGDWTVDWPRKFSAAGTVFHYERLDGQPEVIHSLGPTTEDLVFMVLLQEDNKGISYVYNLPRNMSVSVENSSFTWKQFWSSCSTTCGKGRKTSVPVCINIQNKSRVLETLCDSASKPGSVEEACNLNACPPEWSVSDWSHCSVTCGGGRKMRTVICVQVLSLNEKTILLDSSCSLSKPRTHRHCRRLDCPPVWITGEWGKCSTTCGEGEQRRDVMCMTSDQNKYLMGEKCGLSVKPAIVQKCNQQSCPGPKWTSGKWDKCSARCGKGRQSRVVLCRDHSGKLASGCDPKIRPILVRQCQSYCESKQSPQLECLDRDRAHFCPLVVKHKVCNRGYFFRMCCKSCRDANQMP